MRTKGVNKEQQLKYILECRNSGLTDYQWCQEHGIHPGTFYNWVLSLRKQACIEAAKVRCRGMISGDIADQV